MTGAEREGGAERRAGVTKIGLSCGEREIGRSRSARVLWFVTIFRVVSFCHHAPQTVVSYLVLIPRIIRHVGRLYKKYRMYNLIFSWTLVVLHRK